MDIYGQIKRKLLEIAGTDDMQPIIFSAEVVSVSGEVCSVRIGNLELADVRLKSVVDGENEQLLITPEVGSFVLVADLSNGQYRDLAVVKYSKVSAINIRTTNNFEVVITDGKISVKNSGYSLKKAFDDIIDAIGRLTVTTGVGPSGIPINKVEFDTVKQKLDKLLV